MSKKIKDLPIYGGTSLGWLEDAEEVEREELLLKDLCARLPYGVIVRHADTLVDNDGNETGEFWYKRGYLYDITTLDDMTTTIIESEGSDEEGYEHICDLERSLPYLRPMSSMTEEEKKQYDSLTPITEVVFPCDAAPLVDWLNEHHFDYRGIIEKGLALEAPEGMYKEWISIRGNLKEDKEGNIVGGLKL